MIRMDKIFNKISEAKDEADLEALKHQLFMENVKIQTEKSQIEAEYEEIHREKKNIYSERKHLKHEKKQLELELEELRQSVEYSRKRLREEQQLLDKKVRIVERANELLESDKKNIAKEYRSIEVEKNKLRQIYKARKQEVYAYGLFFRGVNNMVALKKRYKDLMKIYHPDNACGDSDILMKINQEYEELRERYDISMKA